MPIPRSELNKPIAIIDGQQITFGQAEQEIAKGTQIGRQALNKMQKIAFRHSPVTPEERELVEKRFEKLPPGIKVVTMDGFELTPAQMIQEVKRGTPVGEQLAQKELRYVKYVLTGK